MSSKVVENGPEVGLSTRSFTGQIAASLVRTVDLAGELNRKFVQNTEFGPLTPSASDCVPLGRELDILLELHHSAGRNMQDGLSPSTFERGKALRATCSALDQIDLAGAKGGYDLPEGAI